MSKYTERIRECLELGCSKRITDRRNCIAELLNLYDDKEVLQELHENSISKSSSRQTWPCILHIVHRHAISEVDRLSSKENYAYKAISDLKTSSRVVTETIHYANLTTIHLNSSELLPLILQVLGSRVYEAYHDTYLAIFLDHVLQVRRGLMKISYEQWRQLLRCCADLYKMTESQCRKKTVLDTLEMTAKYGSMYCELSLDLKELLSFTEIVLEEVKNSEVTLVESVYRLASTLCRNCCVEFRSAVCEFSEKVLPIVIGMGGFWEKYEFLLLVVKVHCEGKDGGWAYDWEKWRDGLAWMYPMVMKDSKKDTLPESFKIVACEVIKYALQSTVSTPERELPSSSKYLQPMKKQKITAKAESLLYLISSGKPSELWPMIQILTVLLENHPQCLEAKDFPDFLQSVLQLLIQSCKNESIMDDLYKLAGILLHIESSLNLDDSLCAAHWDKIWDILLRSLSMNENRTTGQILAQKFLLHRKVKDTSALMRLYLTQTMKWSLESVRTLRLLCEESPLHRDSLLTQSVWQLDEASTLQTKIIRWSTQAVWPISHQTPCIEEISSLLVNCILKSPQEFQLQIAEENSVSTCYCLEKQPRSRFLHFEECFSFLTYKSSFISAQTKNLIDLKDFEDPEEVKEPEVSYFQDLLSFLTSNLSDITSDSTDDIPTVIFKSTILATTTSCLLRLRILPEFEDSTLALTLKKSMEKCSKLLQNLVPSKTKYVLLINVIRSLYFLYSGDYESQVASEIVSSSSLAFLKNLFSFMNTEDNEAIDFGNNKNEGCNNCRGSVLRLLTVKTLTSFCCLKSRGKSNTQRLLMENLLDIDVDDLIGSVHFDIAIITLSSLKNYGDDLWINHKEIPLEIFLKLHRQCFEDQRSMKHILDLVPFFLDYSIKNKSKFLDILGIIRGIDFARKEYGGEFLMAYLKSLENLALIDPEFRFSKLVENLKFFSSSSSYSVRLQSVESLKMIYTSKISSKWKKEFFSKIVASLEDLLDLEDIDANEKRVNSTLHLLMMIISVDGALHSLALEAIFKMIFEKKISEIAVKKAFSNLGKVVDLKKLMKSNLTSLIFFWISNYPSNKFPINLVFCESEAKFFFKNCGIIVRKKLQDFDVKGAKKFCENSNLKFEELFEKIFPEFLPFLLVCISQKISFDAARMIYGSLTQNKGDFEKVKKFEQLFEENLEKILRVLFERLHDEEDFESIFKIPVTFSKSNFPEFDKETLEKSLIFVEENHLKNAGIAETLTSKPEIIQRILTSLTSNIYELDFLSQKLKSFHQYAFFCKFLIRDIQRSIFDQISKFCIREICHTLLHLSNLPFEKLSEISLKFLFIFLQEILPFRNLEVEEIFDSIITSLSSRVSRNRKSEISRKILEFLIISQRSLFELSISKLNTFPRINEFSEIRSIHTSLKQRSIRKDLEKEIQYFVEVVLKKEDSSCSVEDLSNLRRELSCRKKDLRILYNDLRKLRGVAEDCASSLLHQLLHKLLLLSRSSSTSISIEIAMILGELGPRDLSTIILQPSKTFTKESSDLLEILTYKIVLQLIDFQIHFDFNLRKRTSDLLYSIFSSSWGRKLLNPRYLTTIKSSKESSLNLDHLLPFLYTSSTCGPASKSVSIDLKIRNKVFDPDSKIWNSSTDDSYDNWVTLAACEIVSCITGFYSEALISVCALSSVLSELILPRLIYFILWHSDNKDQSQILITCINRFFEYHFEAKVTNCDHQIVHSMLNIVNYIRIQLSADFSLDFNYLCIARAAQYCSAYFTAILYAEIFCESVIGAGYKFGGVAKIEYVYEGDVERGKIVQSILRDMYIKIGDPDAFFGCGSYSQDRSTRLQYYLHTKRWDKVMVEQDVAVARGNFLGSRDLVKALHHSGLQSLQGTFISTVTKTGERIDDDLLYDSAWRLSDWSLMIPSQGFSESKVAEPNFNYFHYKALKFFREGDETGLRHALKSARASVMNELKKISLESNKPVYDGLMQLQLIREIEELGFATGYEEYRRILRKWKDEATENANEFQYIEPILTQRTVMLGIKEHLDGGCDVFKKARTDTYLELANTAREQGYEHVASRVLALLSNEPDLTNDINNRLSYQEGLLAWQSKDRQIGRYLLRNLVRNEDLAADLKAEVLRTYGDWMGETKSENPQMVIETYYQQSIDTCLRAEENQEEKKSMKRSLHDAQVALARFADARFEQVNSYIKSPEFATIRQSVEKASNSTEMMTSKDQDLRKAVIISHRQDTNDAAELVNRENERNDYLILALRYYLKILQHSEDYNLLIFRVIALWLENKEHPGVNELLESELERIPSFKFIPLVPQLAAHMSNNRDEFSRKIYRVLEQCALQHPHHTLPVLLALKNLYGDYEYSGAKTNKPKIEARVLGATHLVKELMKSEIRSIVCEMEQLSHALVMLANLQSPQCKPGSKVKIPRSQEILKILNFENTMVPTLSLNVKSSANYNIIGIHKYSEAYETVGGINAPKKVVCIGVDGISRQQLVKGKDDLRQDAVMQQVFSVMNILLRTCKETMRRKLTIRTYKVVPLTQRSGILQWCDNTRPIISILVGSGQAGLHKKYYPKEYSATVCRQKMSEVAKASNEEKLRMYMHCCDRMSPSFHHFFTEQFPSPETWFEKRLAYTRSVATTSMVGYILGLGDRHLNNILLDETTAEVIHIDFGVAFEQGKLLTIPEKIPFRLTRNIEAAMGVSGVEGTMRRSCEATLSVMREQRQIIITLLQVLLYDPLFTWAITPLRTSSGTAMSTEGVSEMNENAAKALLRVERKLQGTEDGSSWSVSGQVEKLIQEARDPSNLSQLFHGWQPYI